MNIFSSYTLVIFLACTVILSYLFNVISKKTKIPSVLLLILTGIAVKQVMIVAEVPAQNWFPILEVLGIVGLIMIVLEAALDLELTKEKAPLILRSFAVALFGLLLSTGVCAMIIHFFIEVSNSQAVLYAIPLAIISSAIVIPSVGHMVADKKEFLIYEGTFSDILGIMFFYFLVGAMEAPAGENVLLSAGGNLLITIGLSFLLSYLLILVFHRLSGQVKLFLLISVLILLYAVGKQFHLSSLLIILVFGLILNNHKLFFRGPLANQIKEETILAILSNFKVVTLETSFVVRTFFFIIFGLSIALSALFNIEVFLISLCIIVALYMVRFLVLKIFSSSKVDDFLFIAPRGLITILLFYSIPIQFESSDFETGILLYVILISSGLMSWALIRADKKDVFETVLEEVRVEHENPPEAELNPAPSTDSETEAEDSNSEKTE